MLRTFAFSFYFIRLLVSIVLYSEFPEKGLFKMYSRGFGEIMPLSHGRAI